MEQAIAERRALSKQAQALFSDSKFRKFSEWDNNDYSIVDISRTHLNNPI